jgi:hypothetical protein
VADNPKQRMVILHPGTRDPHVEIVGGQAHQNEGDRNQCPDEKDD